MEVVTYFWPSEWKEKDLFCGDGDGDFQRIFEIFCWVFLEFFLKRICLIFSSWKILKEIKRKIFLWERKLEKSWSLEQIQKILSPMEVKNLSGNKVKFRAYRENQRKLLFSINQFSSFSFQMNFFKGWFLLNFKR